jgi:predicted metal-dependent hydrolase
MADAAGTASAPPAPPPLPTRRLEAEFAPSTPRIWCPGDPFLTHVLNTYTVLVPGNEGFYIRTLRKALPRIADPALREQVTAFSMQEGQHGVAHRRCWAMLAAQGYRFRGYAKAVDVLAYGFVERALPLSIGVAMVACIEHANAYLGHEFLSQRILRDVPRDMRSLFEWHFAEEIEHKAVSWDVLQAVAPGYPTRVAGVLLTLPLFYLLMTAGAVSFLVQDGSLFTAAAWRGAWRHFFSAHRMVARTLGHVARFLRPGFHPWEQDDRALAAAAVAEYAPILTPVTREAGQKAAFA